MSGSSSEAGASGRFEGDIAARVARFFDGETGHYLDDLPTLRAYARRTGGPLLELGCGSGRLLAPLAKAGYRITGVDLSPKMLDLARSRIAAADAGERVTLLEGDFTTIPLGGPFSFAFIVMNTFLHLLSTGEQVRALRHWYEHLVPGGLLLIDVFAPDAAELAGFDGRIEFDKMWQDASTGNTVVKQVVRTVEQAEQLVHLTMMYDDCPAGGPMERTVVSFDLRYIWRFEAELLLRQAGFELEAVYGDWDLAPFDSASERLIVVGRKPAVE
jgi:SAM-dependent methyltransferase